MGQTSHVSSPDGERMARIDAELARAYAKVRRAVSRSGRPAVVTDHG